MTFQFIVTWARPFLLHVTTFTECTMNKVWTIKVIALNSYGQYKILIILKANKKSEVDLTCTIQKGVYPSITWHVGLHQASGGKIKKKKHFLSGGGGGGGEYYRHQALNRTQDIPPKEERSIFLTLLYDSKI